MHPNTALPPLTRQSLEAAIEAAIEALDLLDGDPDAEPDDDAEEDDPGGGDILDEPHDAEEDRCADADSLSQFWDEMWFMDAMNDTRSERRQAREEALQQLADVTGKPIRSPYWPRVNVHPRPRARGGVPVRHAELVDGQLVEVRK